MSTSRTARTRRRTQPPAAGSGSALGYYDFFIYATTASLIFPKIDPKTAISASLATHRVGYVARPIGAFFLGHWGDRHGRKTALIVCMVLMDLSTIGVGLVATC